MATPKHRLLPPHTFNALAQALAAARLYTLPAPNPGMVQRGNIDLLHRPVVRNPDGSISTVRSTSFGMNGGREVLVPEVGGLPPRVLSPQDALAAYRATGQNLGTFASALAADRYAQRLHEQQARFYKPSLARAFGR